MKGKSICNRRMHYLSCLLMMLCLSWLPSAAQYLPFKEYTSDDGLLQAEHHRMIIDSRGYLWRPTKSGLICYDGNTFTAYTRKDGLPSNTVHSVFEDTDGTIWASSKEGLSRFNGKRFRFYPCPDTVFASGVGFKCLAEKPGAFFLDGTNQQNQTSIIYFDNGKYYDYTSSSPALRGKELSAQQYTPDDSTLYLQNRQEQLFRYRNKRLELLYDKPAVEFITDGDLRVRSNNKLFRYDGERWNLYTQNEPSELSEFLGRFYDNPDTLLRILTGNTMNLKWEYGNIAQHINDPQGVLWLATASWIYRLVSDAFVEYDVRSGLMESPSAIFADPIKGLWIGSFSGKLQYFDGEKFFSRNDFRGALSGIPSFFRGSTTGSDGKVLISTGSDVISWDGKNFRRTDLLPESEQVCIIYEDPADKTIFIGTGNGLYHSRRDTVILYDEMTAPYFGVAEGIVRDNNGNFWIASQKSMVFFDGERFTPFLSSADPSAQCWGVIKDNNGNIWSVGSDGLFICDPDAPAFMPALPEAENLPANVIRDIGGRKLLVGRMSDICLIDLDKYYSGDRDYYTILGRNQGYRGFDCQDNGIIQDSDGYWWLLTSNKLIRFDPGKIQKHENPPQTHITRIEYLNDSLAWVSVLDTALFYRTGNEVTIPRGINDVRISYVGIYARNPDGVTYQYRLIGHRNFPPQTTSQRSVTFNDIRPGRYTFELHASNADGVMTAQPETIFFTVAPAIIRTRGSIALMSLAAIAISIVIAFGIRRSVLQKKVQTARQQAESYRLQLNSVIRQFDPHFTFNAVSSVGSLIMKGEKEKAYEYFIKLSGLLRSVLTDSSSLLKPLSEEIEFVTRYCELQKLRFGKRFDYEIKVDQNVEGGITVPKMIIQSFAENAVKHGLENKKGNGRIVIEINKTGRGIEITVKDNGIGRKAATELRTGGSGVGLKNIASLIETVNRFNNEKITFELTDLFEEGEPSGTMVRIFLPDSYNFDLSLK
ncbi:MAG: histidine kinase [Bacteroidales bacterium]|nr:histidine kinase [Bacteroidales bacterium]